MTSIARQIRRKNYYARTEDSKPQYTVYNEDRSYVTLHPTKGWKRVSARRIRAQERMMQQFGFIR